MLRRIFLSLAVLGALALGLETAVTYLAQRGMERALKAQYRLDGDLKVGINSFPLAVSLARNRIRDLRLEWTGELLFRSEAGTVRVPCSCRVGMQDVELDMPAVIEGRLRIRSLSRLRSQVSLELAELGEVLGGGTAVPGENGAVLVSGGSRESEYEVYITGPKRLEFRCRNASTAGQGDALKSQSEVEVEGYGFDLEGLPLEFSLLKVGVDGGRLILNVSIKEWEGYLDASIDSL